MEKICEYCKLIFNVDENHKYGIITYTQDGKLRRYFPDFFNLLTNTIIEIKSKWTYEMDKENINIKETACINKGFKFNLIIL